MVLERSGHSLISLCVIILTRHYCSLSTHMTWAYERDSHIVGEILDYSIRNPFAPSITLNFYGWTNKTDHLAISIFLISSNMWNNITVRSISSVFWNNKMSTFFWKKTMISIVYNFKTPELLPMVWNKVGGRVDCCFGFIRYLTRMLWHTNTPYMRLGKHTNH
jgi:hypothetical protein